MMRHLLFILGMIHGCGTVSIRTTPPEAEVHILHAGKEETALLGKTPYESDVGAIGNMVNEGPIAIVVKKSGYIPQTYFLPNLFSGSLTIDATLIPNLPTNYSEVNRIVGLSFQGERYILQKRFDEAVKIAEEIKQINPNITSAYHLLGTVYFLKNEMKESRFAWIRALELDPNDPEAKTMLDIVEKKLMGTASTSAQAQEPRP